MPNLQPHHRPGNRQAGRFHVMPALRRYAWLAGKPMTRVVAETIERLLVAEGFDPDEINARLPAEQRRRLERRP